MLPLLQRLVPTSSTLTGIKPQRHLQQTALPHDLNNRLQVQRYLLLYNYSLILASPSQRPVEVTGCELETKIDFSGKKDIYGYIN